MDEKIRDKLVPDCFGNVAGRVRCQVLNEDVCLYRDKCPFYKTREQFEADRKKYENVPVSNGPGTGYVRPVRCIELRKVYPSVRAASMDIGISPCSITAVLNGTQDSTRGMRFEYV